MIVLLNCLSSVSGGAVSYLKNIYPYLADEFRKSAGENCLHLLLHESQLVLFPESCTDFFHVVEGPRLAGMKRVFWEMKNLKVLINRISADVLFNPYQVGNVGGVKQVLMLRNMEPFKYSAYKYEFKQSLRNRFLKTMSERSLCKADRVIAVSKYAHDHLINVLNIPAKRIHQIYHGRNPMFSEGDQAEDWILLSRVGVKPGFILTCGSLLPYRRCEDVINAYLQLFPYFRERSQLVIAGSGTDRSYERHIVDTIKSSQYAEKILLLGHVDQQSMAALYRQSRLCIIASEIEACPNIAIEAMTAGCAIVSSDRPPLPEIFQGCSLEFRSRDVADLSRIIMRIVGDFILRDKLKSKALVRANDFSWIKCAQETYLCLTEW